jgi:hypothetical protein
MLAVPSPGNWHQSRRVWAVSRGRLLQRMTARWAPRALTGLPGTAMVASALRELPARPPRGSFMSSPVTCRMLMVLWVVVSSNW